MKILGIDTSTKYLCAGLYREGKTCEYNLELERKLSRLLVTHIQRILNAEKLRISDIDYFACGLGPGSFTGMRVGLATIKALSLIGRKPVIGISTLDIIAMNAEDKVLPVIVALDAKRGMVYCCAYKKKAGALRRQADYKLLRIDDFLKRFDLSAVILGDAIDLYKDKMLKSLRKAIFLESDYWFPAAANLMSLALEKVKNKDFTDTFKVEPIYLYPKECQIKRK